MGQPDPVATPVLRITEVGDPTHDERTSGGLPVPLMQAEEAFDQTRKDLTEHFTTFRAHVHRFEITPWLARTGFWAYLEGQDRDAIRWATAMPGQRGLQTYRKMDDNSEDENQEAGEASLEPALHAIVDAYAGLLKKAGHVMARQVGPETRLAVHDARVLNSLEPNRLNSQPFRLVIGNDTLKKYTQIWQRYLCYVLRMTDPADETLPASLVQVTMERGTALDRLRRQAETPAADRTTDGRGETVDWLTPLEHAVLAASVAFLEHRLVGSPYESAVLRYVAGRSIRRTAVGRHHPTSPPCSAGSPMTSSCCSSPTPGARPTSGVRTATISRTRLTRCYGRSAGKGWPMTRDRQRPRSWAGDCTRARSPPTRCRRPEPAGTRPATRSLTTRPRSAWMAGGRRWPNSAGRRRTCWKTLLLDAGDAPDRPQPRSRHLRDVPGQTRPDHSFVDERSNGLTDHARWLYRRILGDETLSKKMTDRGVISNGALTWRLPIVQTRARSGSHEGDDERSETSATLD